LIIVSVFLLAAIAIIRLMRAFGSECSSEPRCAHRRSCSASSAANADLLIFILVAAAALLARRSAASGALILVAALLKLFPILALGSLLRRPARKVWITSAW